MTSVPDTCGTSRTTLSTWRSSASASLLRSSGVSAADRRLFARTNGLTGMMTQRLIVVPTFDPVHHLPRQARAVGLRLHEGIKHRGAWDGQLKCRIALVVDERIDDVAIIARDRFR